MEVVEEGTEVGGNVREWRRKARGWEKMYMGGRKGAEVGKREWCERYGNGGNGESGGERRAGGRKCTWVAEKVRRWEKMYGDGRKGRKSAKGGSRWRVIGI